MRITFDSAKDERNRAERGLSFDLVGDLVWETAIIWEDTRKDYGERMLAFLGERLHAVVITRRGDAVHVIGFRQANRKEVVWYGKERP